MRGIWKVVAKFSYKDKHIDYSCDIRIRKFSKPIKTCVPCSKAGAEHSLGYRIEHSRSAEICYICKTPLTPDKMWMYCAYVPEVDEYIDVVKILQRNTLGNWRPSQYYKSWGDYRRPVGGVKAIFYAHSIEGIFAHLKTIYIDKNYLPKKLTRRKAESKLEVFPITEEELEECYKKAQNNKLLREL